MGNGVHLGNPNGRVVATGPWAWLYRGLLLAMLLVAAAARFRAPDWDGGIAAHPDERFLLGVAEDVSLFGNVCRAVPDFPYGHLPVVVARLLVLVSAGADPLYAARLVSALVGVLLVALAATCGRHLAGRRGALFSIGVAALSPGLIQQAHFYTADPLGAALVGGAVLAAARGRWRAAGAFSGLAVACKLSLGASGVVLLLALLAEAYTQARARKGLRLVRAASTYLCPGAVAFLIVSPWSLLTPVACWRGPLTQGLLVSGRYVFPYTQQYVGTPPIIYPLVQMGLWGLGPVVALLATGGLVLRAAAITRERSRRVDLAFVWTVLFLGTTAALRVKFPRYLLPLYPWWVGWAAYLLWGRGTGRNRGWRLALALLAAVSTAVLGLAQLGVYDQPHPWQTASRWLYMHLPQDAELVVEAWEHPLPIPTARLGIPLETTGGAYVQTALPVYDEETPAKLAELDATTQADAVILASRRGYNALSREPERYAETLAWYRQLLLRSEVRAFTRCPRIGPLAITDDPLADSGLPVPVSLADRCGTEYALRLPRLDESFRVYDAPLAVVCTSAAE